MDRLIRVEKADLGGIPVLHLYARELTGPAPVILLYHGWCTNKEAGLVVAEFLACEGFRVLLPDLPRHGERSPLPDYFAAEAWAQYWEIVASGAQEAEAILRAADERGWIDIDRVGIAGVSMGGKVALAAMARLPWIRAAATMISCPAFTWLEEEARAGRGQEPLTAIQWSAIEANDPIAQVDRLARRPILLMNGTADQSLPIEGARRFVTVAQPLYADAPDRLRLIEYPGLTHWASIVMLRDTRSWFATHL